MVALGIFPWSLKSSNLAKPFANVGAIMSRESSKVLKSSECLFLTSSC